MTPESKHEKKQAGVRLRCLCFALLLCGLSACGKKGPLYLPPGIIPLLKPVPEATVKSTAKPAITPVTDATGKASPAAADKLQP